MILGILIGICIYSLILTVITLYRDSSSYFFTYKSDVLIAGPVMWVYLFLYALFYFPYLFLKGSGLIKPKEKKQKNYSQEKVKKIIQKVIQVYQKDMEKRTYVDYFDLSLHSKIDYNMTEGWDNLLIKKPKYERLNRQFERLMWYQKEETLAILTTYFDLLTKEEVMAELGDWYAMDYMKDGRPGIYRIKGAEVKTK